MKITDVEALVVHVTDRGDWVFIRVHTSQGLVGLGEASASGDDVLLLSALKRFKERLVGRDPLRIQALWTEFHDVAAGRVVQTALSGIEQALWDIMGQYLEVPIHALFGGKVRDRLRLYANVNRHIRDRSPQGFARAAKQAVNDGFTAIKIAPFDELDDPDHVRTGPRAAWRPGVERVEAVRAVIGAEVELAVDCHRRMDASEAMIVAEALEEYDLYWYEEPVPCFQVDKLARVTATASVMTASAEGVYGLEGFRPFLTRPVVDVIMPDVKHAGGLSETKRIADAARMNQVLVSPHNPAGPVATAATAQVMSVATNFLILEFAWGEVDWRSELLQPPELVEDGDLILPTGPGLGHSLDPTVLESHLRVH